MVILGLRVSMKMSVPAMVMMPVVRFTSLRSTPGSRRVTRSTEALQAAQ